MSDLRKRSSVNPSNKQDMNSNKRMGVYLGEVMDTADVTKTGSLRVFIAALARDKKDQNGYFDCIWSSPFAGGTNYGAIDVNDTKSYIGTQKSYGMWMIPPDKGNLVLVAFGDGNLKYPIIISCLYPHKANHMVPGIPGSIRNYGSLGNNLPVAEKNKFDPMPESGTDILRPAHHDLAEAITKQGLINDTIRGASSSGAKRESPSEVFGILTPGALDPKNPGHRTGGHQFIMDDNKNSKNIRLRTSGGNQILLDDNQGTVYIINKSGKAWLELASDGSINIYGERSLNVRTKGDFNLRADKDVKIEAGGDVKIKAAGDNLGEDYLGVPPQGVPGGIPLGYGGHIRLESVGEFTSFAGLNSKITSFNGDIDINAAGTIRESGLKLDQNIGALGISTITLGAHQSISALGTTLTSAGPVSALGSLILLNSGTGPIPTPAIPASVAPQLELQSHTDQPLSQPEYDREAEQVLPENGERPGGPTEIESLVGVLVTAEPWDGHTSPDPISHDSESMAEDESADVDPSTQTPEDANTPAGYKAVIEKSLATVKQARDASGSKLDKYKDKIKGVGDDLIGPFKDKLSNFSAPGLKYLESLQGFSNYTDILKNIIPPIRFPIINSFGQQVIGQSKTLTELQARFKSLGIGADGIMADFQDLKATSEGYANKVTGLQNKVDSTIGDVFSKAGLPGGSLQDFSNLANTLQNDVSVDSLNNIIKDINKNKGNG